MPYYQCPQCQLMLHVAGPHIITGDCPRCDLPMLHVPDRHMAAELHEPASESQPPARAA
jgi:peptide subunit release factor 1 (eRF1)